MRSARVGTSENSLANFNEADASRIQNQSSDGHAQRQIIEWGSIDISVRQGFFVSRFKVPAAAVAFPALQQSPRVKLSRFPILQIVR